MNEHLNRFFGITEKDIDETNNIKYSNDDEKIMDVVRRVKDAIKPSPRIHL